MFRTFTYFEIFWPLEPLKMGTLHCNRYQEPITQFSGVISQKKWGLFCNVFQIFSNKNSFCCRPSGWTPIYEQRTLGASWFVGVHYTGENFHLLAREYGHTEYKLKFRF